MNVAVAERSLPPNWRVHRPAPVQSPAHPRKRESSMVARKVSCSPAPTGRAHVASGPQRRPRMERSLIDPPPTTITLNVTSGHVSSDSAVPPDGGAVVGSKPAAVVLACREEGETGALVSATATESGWLLLHGVAGSPAASTLLS